MTDEEKSKFLGIKTYEEFCQRRSEFNSLSMKDPEVRAHVKEVFPRLEMVNEELSKMPGGSIGR